MGKISTGIFGGSFNPVHNGHIAIAKALLDGYGLDEIWLVVSPQNPMKRQADLLDDATRLGIVRRAVAGEPRLHASGYEMVLPRPSYMWNTLSRMAADMPERSFTLLIGADNWQVFDRWYHHEDIMRNHRIVVYPRRGSEVDARSLPAGVTLADVPLLDISSTEIRRRVRSGEPVDGLVPDCVKETIIECYEGCISGGAGSRPAVASREG